MRDIPWLQGQQEQLLQAALVLQALLLATLHSTLSSIRRLSMYRQEQQGTYLRDHYDHEAVLRHLILGQRSVIFQDLSAHEP